MRQQREKTGISMVVKEESCLDLTSPKFRFDGEVEWEVQRDQEEVLAYDDGVTEYESSDEEPWRVGADYSDPTDMGMKVCGSDDDDDDDRNSDSDYDMDAWKDVAQSWDRSG